MKCALMECKSDGEKCVMDKNPYIKCLIRLFGMLIVGFSVVLISNIGIWFLFPWIIGWFVYDLNTSF